MRGNGKGNTEKREKKRERSVDGEDKEGKRESGRNRNEAAERGGKERKK